MVNAAQASAEAPPTDNDPANDHALVPSTKKASVLAEESDNDDVV